jgi:hypothetical protein
MMRPISNLCTLGLSSIVALTLLGGCAQNRVSGKSVASASSVAPPTPLPQPTIIADRAGAQRLLGAKGVTLQWISWDRRGNVNVREQGGTIYLTGSQSDPHGSGQLYLDGWVEEVGADYFVFRGTIRITDTPDGGRKCERQKLWHFAVTQNRPYWRLREFEWCDYLTDYVDIYF